MIVLESKLAKKYAVAFLNTFCDATDEKKRCSLNDIDSLHKLHTFISGDKIFQAVLSLPSLTTDQKQKIIVHVADTLHLEQCATRLMMLLLKDKRIDLLDEILKKIFFLQKKRAQKYHFDVTTSHELTPDEQQAVTNFIKTLVPNHITATFTIDTNLISGIKIKGDTLLLERSIAKQLRFIEHNSLNRE